MYICYYYTKQTGFSYSDMINKLPPSLAMDEISSSVEKMKIVPTTIP